MESILDTIHNTPLFKLPSVLVPEDFADIYAKLEYFNPCGSVKDRICLAMVEAATREGHLDLDDLEHPPTIIEPTSGNTGLGLGMVCAARGIKLIIVMPENYSIERRFLLRQFGAELVLTPGVEEMTGALNKARELASKIPNSFLPDQFSNKHNPLVHVNHTASEILQDLPGKAIDAFVVGVGTAGTFTGVGSVLKKEFPWVQLVAVEPSSCAVISGELPRVHEIQGIGPGFIPENLDLSLIDEIIKVDDREAFDAVKRLSKKSGLLVGVSSGANYWASLEVAKRLGTGKAVVTVFPDRGERYFSVEKFVA